MFVRQRPAKARGHHQPRLETLEPRKMLDAAAPVPVGQSATAEFVENLGQWDTEIHYVYRTRGANVAFTERGLSFVGFRPGAEEADILAEAVNMRFDGAAAVAPVGLDQTPGRFNYHVGADSSRWIDGARAFATITYERLYDGVDLFVSGGAANLKYEYHLAPGASPADIIVRYDGAEDITIDDTGALHVDLGEGELIDDAPIAYQDIDGVRVAVASAFAVGADGGVSFTLGAYDPTADLVIDPSLQWGAYIGGSGGETAYAVTLDAYKCVYATGYTTSTGWISGGFDTTYGGNNDAFVIKYTRKGTRLWSTYLGGDSRDEAFGIAISNAGRVYVVGFSTGDNWTSGGVGDHTHNGSRDIFIVRLRRTGTHAWSCFMGGSGSDEAKAVTCSSNEAVHIAGQTASAGWIPKGPDTTHNGGTSDGFYARVWVNGLLLRGSYLGGGNADKAEGVAVDGRGDVLVCGETWSAGWAKKGKDTTLNGDSDGFLTKFAAGGRHVWSRYIGGSGQERALAVTVGANNKVYVAGITHSASWASGGWDTSYATTGDGFVYGMKTTGQHLWSTYLGGTGTDQGNGITADSRGDVYVVGHSNSAGWATGGWDTSSNGVDDGFAARFTSMGTHKWSSYMGGGALDRAYGVVPDTFNGIHIVGGTMSSGWLTGGFDTSLTGTTDGFALWAKR